MDLLQALQVNGVRELVPVLDFWYGLCLGALGMAAVMGALISRPAPQPAPVSVSVTVDRPAQPAGGFGLVPAPEGGWHREPRHDIRDRSHPHYGEWLEALTSGRL